MEPRKDIAGHMHHSGEVWYGPEQSRGAIEGTGRVHDGSSVRESIRPKAFRTSTRTNHRDVMKRMRLTRERWNVASRQRIATGKFSATAVDNGKNKKKAKRWLRKMEHVIET